jgi:hypothetical protein
LFTHTSPVITYPLRSRRLSGAFCGDNYFTTEARSSQSEEPYRAARTLLCRAPISFLTFSALSASQRCVLAGTSSWVSAQSAAPQMTIVAR